MASPTNRPRAVAAPGLSSGSSASPFVVAPSGAAAAPALSQALGHPMADKRLDVLRAIAATGSISQAARAVGVSYKAAWQALDTLTNLAGVALVVRSVGGAGGGGATLTAAGVELLAAAQTWLQARQAAVQPASGTTPSVAIPPALAAGLGMRTSMRNQWPAQVEQLQVQGPMVAVQLRAGNADTITVHARLTTESAQLLSLQVGHTVLVMAKATAVQVAPAGAPSDWPAQADNAWAGVATRVARGALGDEVAVSFPAGVQIVGFAAAGSGLRKGRKVRVHVPAFAVVLGV